jgi:hypothetical protein
VVPNAVLRVLLAISALIAALLIAGLGAGLAAADPADPGNTPEPQPSSEPLPPSEPAPTSSTPASIFDIPQTIATQLRDMFGRPLSIFGNGRVPGTLTVPDATTPETSGPTNRKRDKPPAKVKEVPKPGLAPPAPVVPAKREGSSVNVVLPFSPPVSVPIPPPPVPGYQSMQLTLDLSDPSKAYASVGETLKTVNSLLTDAYAPYDPFKPPPPTPEPQLSPTFRTLEQEPSVVDAGGTDGVAPLSSGSSPLPVMQAPVVVPQVRFGASRPITGSIPAEQPQMPGAGSAAVRAPKVRGSGPQPGSPGLSVTRPSEQLLTSGSVSATANPPLREGYPRYLRSARINEVATVALPGLAGLIAITASGSVIGYRQANSGRFLRSGAARFLQ